MGSLFEFCICFSAPYILVIEKDEFQKIKKLKFVFFYFGYKTSNCRGGVIEGIVKKENVGEGAHTLPLYGCKQMGGADVGISPYNIFSQRTK